MGEGIIIKGIGGFYYVADEKGRITTCRAAGALRGKVKPAVGDRAVFLREQSGEALLTEIKPRESYITRPVAANVTQGVIVCALKEPATDFLLLDKLLADNVKKGVKTVLCFTKLDLAEDGEISFIRENYSKAAEKLFFVSALHEQGLSELKSALLGQVSLLRGVSGAGKSSLLNALIPEENREIGSLSKKLARGKNTTRESVLLMLSPGSYILDTPGFSDFTLSDIPPEDIWKYYPEFYEYSDCRYDNCLHLNEPCCAVKEAVEDGKISVLRYENYKKLVEAARKMKKY